MELRRELEQPPALYPPTAAASGRAAAAGAPPSRSPATLAQRMLFAVQHKTRAHSARSRPRQSTGAMTGAPPITYGTMATVLPLGPLRDGEVWPTQPVVTQAVSA